MADEQHGTGDEQRMPQRGRWLRWGSVYVDIEPPPGPNPWTAPGWADPATAGAPPLAAVEPARSRRGLVLFALAALAAALVGFLLVALFADDDRPPVLAVSTSTSRPRPATTTPPASTTTPAAPTTAPTTGPTTVPRPSSAPTTAAGGAGTTVARPGGGAGPITIPEGVPPSAAPVPSTTVTPTTTVPPTTTTSAGPVAFLGVTVEESFDEGVLVIDVLSGTGADAAGLLPGDVITAVDATAVRSPDELRAAIVAHQPGDSITVTVLRNGTAVTMRATLGQR